MRQTKKSGSCPFNLSKIIMIVAAMDEKLRFGILLL